MTPPSGRIPIAGPWITQKEIDYVTDAVTTNWYGNAGEYVGRFERAFAEHTGRRHAVSLPSCTSAIHLSLAAMGVGPGDEVVVPDATWIASSAPITYVGAEPVFADVDPSTWCLDARAFERAITPRTKAVIPVALYGSLPDWNAILSVARERGLRVIEDAAEAAGSTDRGRPAGAFGDTAVFSFHGSKTLTTGEGGLLVTDDDALHDRVQVLRDHGRSVGDTMFRNREVAYKYKMSALQAALGLAQLERLEELVARKREIFGWYREELAGAVQAGWITLNAEPDGTRNAYWMVTIVASAERVAAGATKENVVAALARRGIDSRPFFSPLSSLDAYGDAPSSRGAAERNPVSYRLGAAGVNLPSALNLNREQVSRVGEAVRAIFASPAAP